MKTKRKSMKEIRLQERLRGFEECFEIFVKAWRDNQRVGSTYDIPVKMWPVIEEADSKFLKLDKDYKKIMWPRVYGEEF